MKNDRFLIGILAGIGVIILLAVGLFFTRRTPQTYDTSGEPASVVRNYVMALHNKDIAKAYSYLAEHKARPNEAAFREFVLSNEYSRNDTSLRVGETRSDGDTAIVDVTILRSGGGPFADVSREVNYGRLVLQQGAWKLEMLPYPYMNWDWFQPTTIPAEKVP